MSKRIAVIGAGLAGLACATRLAATVSNVQVFDKSRGVSGRLSTRRGEGWQADHGAQYFTAHDPDFIQQVHAWENAGVVQRWTPDLRVIGSEHRTGAHGDTQRYVGVPAMTAPARALAETLHVCTQSTVQSIHRTGQGWQIHFLEAEAARNAPAHFDQIVLAVPAPQAEPLLSGCGSALAANARQAVMRPCWSLMVRFDQPVSIGFSAAFVNEGPLRWIARDTSKPGRPATETWVLHANPDWSDQHLEDTPEDVAKVLLAQFQGLGAPLPQTWVAHRWRYSQATQPLKESFLYDSDLGLGVCGDWVTTGTVEGAWVSGTALARHLLSV